MMIGKTASESYFWYLVYSFGTKIRNVTKNNTKIIKNKKVGTQRSGTGDIFASIIAADCVNGVNFETSVRKAAGFIKKCIAVTENYNVPKTDGVCFEDVLYTLK